jgi:hypothetical protein
MELLLVLIISAVNIIFMSLSMTFFLIKGYEHIIFENIINVATKKKENLDSEPLIRDQMNIILKKFNTSFIVLEISLIFYFFFWCILLYLNAKT